MSIFQRLLLLFIFVPILEIYLLISVGSVIGVLPTVMLVIITAILGTYLLRAQGLATLHKLQNALNEGQSPTRTLLEGILLLIGGVLLLTPGFFTDAIGFLCLLPVSRGFLVTWLGQYMQPVATTTTYQSASGNVHHTIEGEYRREDRP